VTDTESEVFDDAVYEDFPEARKRRPWVLVLLVLLAAIVVAGVLAVGWVRHQIDPGGRPGELVTLDIPRGSSSGRIGTMLHDKGVIGSTTVWRYYVKARGAGPFQAGTYSFRRNDSMGHAIDVLDQGPKLSFERITIPEGYTLEQIAQRVEQKLPGRSAAKFLDLARTGAVRSKYEPDGSNNLEGLLQPETYTLDVGANEEQILQKMVQAFETEADQLDLPGKAQALGLSPYQVVIVASLVEREAKVAEDRGPIARVIYNRLDKKIALGIDASDRYGLNKPTGPLTKSDLAKSTPYSTRTRQGLPPTPIANPSREALAAAVDPTPGPWIFYVLADASGKHAFATTGAEFERLKNEARKKGLL
jgi:UPF0755 protein